MLGLRTSLIALRARVGVRNQATRLRACSLNHTTLACSTLLLPFSNHSSGTKSRFFSASPANGHESSTIHSSPPSSDEASATPFAQHNPTCTLTVVYKDFVNTFTVPTDCNFADLIHDCIQHWHIPDSTATAQPLHSHATSTSTDSSLPTAHPTHHLVCRDGLGTVIQSEAKVSDYVRLNPNKVVFLSSRASHDVREEEGTEEAEAEGKLPVAKTAEQEFPASKSKSKSKKQAQRDLEAEEEEQEERLLQLKYLVRRAEFRKLLKQQSSPRLLAQHRKIMPWFIEYLASEPEKCASVLECEDYIDQIEMLVPMFISYARTLEKQTKPGQQSMSASLGLHSDEKLEFLANLTEPHEWYPLARGMKRRIIMHVGPTNSGKTYSALKRLREAESGMYGGPLRLLAWEIHESFRQHNVPCNLLTGQECVMEDGALHTASTIEMMNTNRRVEVAVLDEMQMVGSTDRGAAWTRALLGVAASEIHVCGDATMVDIVKEMCSVTGDDFEIHTYKRLTPLEVSKSIQGLKNVQPGDAIVAFSRRELYQLKNHIETTSDLKCCIVYGSLPPPIRKLQAQLFNDPESGYDVIVASDAIGMGLNLNIRRVVFSSMEKFDGVRVRDLNVSEVLQIGGRAGRFSSAYDLGYVSTLYPEDAEFLKRQWNRKLTPIRKAGLAPEVETIEQISQQRPDLSLSAILLYLKDYASVDNLYFMCEVDDMVEIADAIEELPMSVRDRFTFCLAPIKGPLQLQALKEFASVFAKKGVVQLTTNNLFDPDEVPTSSQHITELEDMYYCLDLYVWLSRRYPATMFPDQESAIITRDRAAHLIDEGLKRMTAAVALRKTQRRSTTTASYASSATKSSAAKPEVHVHISTSSSTSSSSSSTCTSTERLLMMEELEKQIRSGNRKTKKYATKRLKELQEEQAAALYELSQVREAEYYEVNEHGAEGDVSDEARGSHSFQQKQGQGQGSTAKRSKGYRTRARRHFDEDEDLDVDVDEEESHGYGQRRRRGGARRRQVVDISF